jgi:hypothetical protein
MNNDTNTIEERSTHLERIGQSHNHQSNSNRSNNDTLQANVDEELQWICLKVLALSRQQAPAASMGSPRQMILYLSNTYDGIHGQRFQMLCHGLSLMSKGHFREALATLTPILTGRVELEFELFREVTLKAHAFCLHQLDYDDDALEGFTALLVQKFTETRDHGEADHISRLLGLANRDCGEGLPAAVAG